MRRRLLLVFAATGVVAACHATINRRMWNHYERANALQVALLGGELTAAQGAGWWVAEHQSAEGLPPGLVEHRIAVRVAANAVSAAANLRDAAMASGRMGAGCGSCHAAAGRGPRFAVSAPPAAGTADLAQRMTLHQWAVTKLWEGLTGPSDSVWMLGADGLSGAPDFARHIVRSGAPPALAESLATRLHELGRSARLSQRDYRAATYGEALATCADCHARYRVRVPQPVIGR